MKTTELRKVLSESGVQSRAYSIEGHGADDEQYRLERTGKWWQAYYYERGHMNDVREFLSEDEACNYFLNLLLSDPTTRS